MKQLCDDIEQLTIVIRRLEAPRGHLDEAAQAADLLTALRTRLLREAKEVSSKEAEEMAAAEERVAKDIRARHAAKPDADLNASIPCPVCNEGTVHYRIAASDNHIAARCSTNHCVSFLGYK